MIERLVATSLTRARSWKRVSPPATPVAACGRSLGSGGSSSLSTVLSMSRPNGDGIQSMAERKLKNPKPSSLRRQSARSAQASRSTRTQTCPASVCHSTRPSPSTPRRRASSASTSLSAAGASVSAAGASVSTASVDDNRLTPPALAHVLVLDALLQHDDPLEKGLGPGRAAGHVHVHRHDLVNALGGPSSCPSRGRRSWRTTPWRSRTWDRASARRGGAPTAPSCR